MEAAIRICSLIQVSLQIMKILGKYLQRSLFFDEDAG